MFNKIVFFGASVTCQNVDHQGEKTGYVAHFIDHITSLYGNDIEVFQFGMVGSHFDSAANMCLSDFSHLVDKQTLVVSEWNSTTLPAFRKPALVAYYNTLYKHGAVVLNLVLPMLSAVQNERTNIKQTRSEQGKRCYQLNLYKAGLDLTKCIRDDQHTTVYGGKEYARVLFEAFRAFNEGGEPPNDEGETIGFRDALKSYPPFSFAPFKGVYEAGERINVTVYNGSDESIGVQLFSKIFKGPKTAQLRVSLNGENFIHETWSKYTYYVHKTTTFAPISPELALKRGVNIISIEVGADLPNYDELSEDNEKARAFMKQFKTRSTHLNLADGIYILGADNLSISVNVS